MKLLEVVVVLAAVCCCWLAAAVESVELTGSRDVLKPEKVDIPARPSRRPVDVEDPAGADIGDASSPGDDRDEERQQQQDEQQEQLLSEFEEQRRELSDTFRLIFGSDHNVFGGTAPQPGPSRPGAGLLSTLFGHRGPRNWWQGENVCTSREESEDGQQEDGEDGAGRMFSTTFTSSSCQHLAQDVYRCTTSIGMPGYTKTTQTTYQCCHGYTRPTSSSQCIKVDDLMPLLDTASDLNATEFVKAAQATGVSEELNMENVTVFVPSNEAFAEMNAPVSFSSSLESQYLVDARRALLGHVLDGWRHSSTFEDEQMMETRAGVSVRTNIYRTRALGTVMTVNCARVLSTDKAASNGYIHMIDRFLSPPSESGDSMWQRLQEQHQFTILVQVLRAAGLHERLAQPDGQLTLFAPTNQAFEKLSPDVLERLITGDKCTSDALSTHILPNVICSTVIQDTAVTPNILGQRVRLSREEGSLLLEGKARVTEADMMASNGVIHVVDDVLLSDDARSFLELANSEGNSVFLDMLDQAGLSQSVDTLRNVTVFIPTDQAFNSLSADASDRLGRDNSYLRRVLQYHVVRPTQHVTDLHRAAGGRQLHTLVDGANINVRSVSQFPFGFNSQVLIQCARVVRSDLHACGSVSHIIDQVLTPPEDSLLTVLDNTAELSTTRALLKDAGLDDTMFGEGGEEGQEFTGTMLAPSNAAWDEYFASTNTDRASLTPEDIERIISQHLLPDATICCSSVSQRGRGFLFDARRWRTLSDASTVEIYRDGRGEIYAQAVPFRLSGGFGFGLARQEQQAAGGRRGKVEQCDHTTGSSILHVIDTVLEVPRAAAEGGGEQEGDGDTIRGDTVSSSPLDFFANIFGDFF